MSKLKLNPVFRVDSNPSIEDPSRDLNSLELVQWPVFRLAEEEEEACHSVRAVGGSMLGNAGERPVLALVVDRRGISGPTAR